MPTKSTRRIYMLVRTVSNSRIKPDIDVACTLMSQARPSLRDSYCWCKEDLKAPDGTTVGTLWARIPKDQGSTSCEILDWYGPNNARELLRSMEVDISEQVAQEVSRRFRIGKLSWESGVERGPEYAHAHMHVRSNEDREADEDWDEERHIWWDIHHVDVLAS
jgi:hypothetical protein